MDRRVSRANVPQVGLKVLDVDGVETDYGGEEADVRLRNILAPVIRALTRTQVFLNLIKGFEKREEVLLIRVLRSRKSGFINTVIDEVVCPVIMFIDLTSQLLWVENDVFAYSGKVVEFRVHEPNNIRGLVGDYAVGFCVVEGWDCEAALVFWINAEIDILEVAVGFVAFYWVWMDV